MNQTTEQAGPKEREFSPQFILWLVTIACATIVLVFLNENRPGIQEKYMGPTPFPWVIAAGHTLNNGLLAFSGRPMEVPDLISRIGLLANILVFLIIGPTLFFFGWRMRIRERTDEGTRYTWRVSRAIFILGGILILPLAIASIPVSIIQRSVSAHMREQQQVQSTKDTIIMELDDLAWRSREYRILPVEHGGGGGVFKGYVIPSDMGSTVTARYSCSVSDSGIAFTGVSKEYPADSVVVFVDRNGQMSGWRYTPNFD